MSARNVDEWADQELSGLNLESDWKEVREVFSKRERETIVGFIEFVKRRAALGRGGVVSDSDLLAEAFLEAAKEFQ